MLLALLAIVCAAIAATPALATSPPTSVTLVFTNSSSLAFSVALPVGEPADQLRVFVQPENGNATDAYFAVVSPGPMRVEVNHLRPSAQYTFSFSLISAYNGSSTAVVSPTVKTYSLGPQITGFFAQDPSADSGDADDKGFNTGDQLLIAFDADTNTPDVGNADAIKKLFSFSTPIGAAYSGSWANPRLLVLTVSDAGQSMPALGSLTVSIMGDIHTPDGLSDQSRSVSPPLTGSWTAFTDSNPRYLVPVDPTTGALVDAGSYQSYGVVSTVNQNVRIPLTLSFPSSSTRTSGYVIFAEVSFPTSLAAVGFQVTGQNFTGTVPESTIGPTKTLTNAQLIVALKSLTFIPRADYVGYASVKVSLVDAQTTGIWGTPIAVSYVTIRIDGVAEPDIPKLTAGEDGGSNGLLSDPIDAIKTYKTPLIIGLCVVFGFFILVGLGIFLYKKRRSGRDEKDFEGNSLTEDEAPPPMGESGPTRRFYYDAKV